MTVLPDDMFDDMSSLTFMHFAAFMTMTKLPSFQGLTNLRSLTLACFLSIVELPEFNNLQKLERLVLASMPAMDSLPDLSPVADLKSFAVSDRGAWCCNGFIGECNLEDRKCGLVHPVWGNPAVTCLASNRTGKVATTATLKLVEKFSSTICGPVLEAGILEGPPTEELMTPCNGTMYRQCPRADNVESMCYNARFMRIADCLYYKAFTAAVCATTLTTGIQDTGGISTPTHGHLHTAHSHKDRKSVRVPPLQLVQ
ncbi:Leucine-rich repeat domain, L domain-like [Phytophthora cactorum]|nr:Leucine-rich repeat domain, L domain-like [Phytophthora cactorum]